MLWIPITIAAALAQTVRNAAQRHLIGELGTLGATLVRFLYGLPFAVIWLAAVVVAAGVSIPAPGIALLAWSLAGGLAQIAGTALLLQTMHERNFAVGVAYSKTEVVQVAVFALVLLGDPLNMAIAAAVACGTAGVLLLAPADPARPWRSLIEGFASRSALLGLGSGAGFALSAVCYRAATHAAGTPSFVVNAALTLVVAQAMQTLLLGGWLWLRTPEVVVRTLEAWRVSLFAGFMGTAASAAWFTAFAIEPVARVRTLGLIEMIFSYAVSRRFFRERLAPRELAGMALIALAVIAITLL
ncbi:MAG: DMT family transporter [Burkholderiales bacterium]|nr:DMT family transporter [Burkholderiales bacterium]